MKRVSVDLASELAECRVATEGARVLADVLVYDAATDEETRHLMPRRISAVLNLVVERLKQVERVANSTASSTSIRAHHNAALSPDGLHVPAWSPQRMRQELAREQRRLDFEERRGRRRGRP